MTDAPPPSLSLLQRVHEIVDRFEAAWRAGSAPSLETFLAEISDDGKPELLRGLLRVELEQRVRAGNPLLIEEITRRFKPLGPFVAGVLASLGLEEAVVLTLDIVGGPHAGATFELAGHTVFVVGREPATGIQLVLDKDNGVSRQHFLIEFNPPFARLADRRSKNGTHVNGSRVTETELRDGDEIKAGQTTFRVRIPAGRGTMTLNGFESPPTDLPSRTQRHTPDVPGYVIEYEVGRGGMGVVYRARRRSDKVQVAIKTVLPAMTPRPETMQRFQREMSILQRLTHPNIVSFLDAGESKGVLWFIMEYIDGVSAATQVKRNGPYKAEKVVTLGCQLLDALAHAHLQGFVHRDVKPGNILLAQEDGREVVKLADFGLSRAYHESAMSGLTMAGVSGGTPGFMAPEQVTDFRAARPPADQFAVGATLYYMLTGAMIYPPTTNAVDQFYHMMQGDPLPLRPATESGPALPQKLGDVIRRSLSRDPRKRFPDVLAMRGALHQAG